MAINCFLSIARYKDTKFVSSIFCTIWRQTVKPYTLVPVGSEHSVTLVTSTVPYGNTHPTLVDNFATNSLNSYLYERFSVRINKTFNSF
jgi:hypothetical protein